MATKKTWNASLEKRVIRVVTEGGMLGQKLLAQLTEDHFRDEVSLTAYRRVRTLLTKRSVVISWRDLIEDQQLDDFSKNSLRTYDQTYETERVTAQLTEHLFDNLDRYARHRALVKLHNEMGAMLSQEDLDVDEVRRDLNVKFNELNTIGHEVEVTTLGVGDNAAPMVQRIIDGEAVNFVPTGFSTYDTKNVGIPLGSYMMVAATTGGGKSALAKKLARNFAMAGASTALIPLEMSNEGVLQRNLAEESGISMNKFLDPRNRMTNADRDNVWNSYVDLSEEIAKRGAKMSLMRFKNDISIQDLLLYCKPLGYRVVIIDYLGLLEGADSDDQAKAMGRMARYAKLWAEANNAIVIGCAQLSADGLVRYSRAMTEHASTLWQWVYTPASAETRSIHISQPKSRQQEAFSFDLHFDPSTMAVRDMTEDEVKELRGNRTPDADEGGGKGKAKGAKTSARYFDDLNEIS